MRSKEGVHGEMHAGDGDEAREGRALRADGDAPMWSGRPNGALVAEIADLEPGRALDLGCGEGADAIWLARRGWTVTAVDPSAVALRRARTAEVHDTRPRVGRPLDDTPHVST